MSTPLERIQNDLTEAMRAREKLRLSTLRLLLSDLKNEAIRRQGDVDEPTFLGLVQRGIKQRREAAETYRTGGRAELADKEEAEAEILRVYLPPPVSEGEVRAAIVELVEREELAGPQSLGRIMGVMMPRFKGQVDGRVVQQLAREVLG